MNEVILKNKDSFTYVLTSPQQYFCDKLLFTFGGIRPTGPWFDQNRPRLAHYTVACCLLIFAKFFVKNG